jgi:hypothetical protein
LLAQQLSPEVEGLLISCLVGVVLVPIAIPWGYVFKQYVMAPGDPWRKQRSVESGEEPLASPARA